MPPHDLACADARVKLMIAYRLYYEPTHIKALEIIRSGHLGLIQSLDANHGSNMRAGEWRLTKSLGGGGPMLDHGVYPLSLFRWLTGEQPVAFQAMISTPDRDARFTEVEENVQWVQRFPSGALASGSGSYGVELGGYWRAHGPWGWLQMISITSRANTSPATTPPARKSARPGSRSTSPAPRRTPCSSPAKPTTSPAASSTTAPPRPR